MRRVCGLCNRELSPVPMERATYECPQCGDVWFFWTEDLGHALIRHRDSPGRRQLETIAERRASARPRRRAAPLAYTLEEYFR